jgi:hypothetical protein
MDVNIELYIGMAEGDGSQLDAVKEILTECHENFVLKGVVDGYWGGVPKETLVVMITDYEAIIRDTVEKLKRELGLDHIAIAEVGDLYFL